MNNVRLEIQTSHPQLIELCRSYWDFIELETGLFSWRFKVTDLAEKYGLRVSDVFVTVRQHSSAFYLPIQCAECGNPCKLSSRSDCQHLRSRGVTPWRCPACTDKEAQAAAEQLRKAAQEAADRRRKDDENKQGIITHFLISLQSTTNAPDVNTMGLSDAIFLSSMLRLGANEEITYISPICSFAELLSPSGSMDIEIAKQLYKQRILDPHHHSPVNAFTCENGELKSFNVLDVAWGLSGSEKNGPTLKALFFALETIFRTQALPEHWNDQIPLFKKEVLLREALQYFQVAMEEHHFDFTPGEKTFQVLNETLEMFSLGQTFNIIWRAARDAAAYFVREQIPKLQAANSVVGNIQRYAQRAHASKWELVSYRRDRRCPQSMISQVLFNSVLQIGDTYLDIRNASAEVRTEEVRA